MANRPYFKHGIEQLQTLVSSSRDDLKTLRVIQYELRFRDRPKARALRAEVDDLVFKLSTESSVPRGHPVYQYPQTPTPMPAVPERIAVECGKCKTPNFVSTLEGVMQHLSCSSCKSPYEAQFKYGVMRTTFHAMPTKESSTTVMKWFVITIAVLVVVMLIAK